MRLTDAAVVAAIFLVAQQAAPPATLASVKRSTATYDSYLTGNAADVTRKTTGGLVLAGGGTDVPDASRWLIAHAGGGDVVVIRASGADGYNGFMMGLGPADSVESIVFKSREASSDPEIIRTLEHAEAVFLAGGDQGNYIKYWKDTPLEDTLNVLAKRGVPIGGTSAGLAVLGQFGFAALNDGITSEAALADPFSDKITIERDFLAMPHMTGIITDSHFVERDRMGRTLVFLARLVHDKWTPRARAIAIDSKTAVLVEADGTAAVVGSGPAYFLETTAPATLLKARTPVSIAGINAYRVKAGATFDLTTWTGTGGTAYVLSIDAGQMKSSNGSVY